MARVKEAEVYHTMGLYSESLDIYSRILEDETDLDPQTREDIESKLNLVKQDIEKLEAAEGAPLSTEDLTLIKETLGDLEDPSVIHTSARSFKELGLHNEAIEEYRSLLGQDYPMVDYIPEMFDCMLHLGDPKSAVTDIEQIIQENASESDEKAELFYLVGMELETRGQLDSAIEILELAARLDPRNEQVKSKAGMIRKSMSSGSRYDYLLKKDLITADKLKQALEQSKKTNKSVEMTLIEQFGLEKEAVGESLSLYYGCAFKGFKEDFPTPVELIGKLKKPFLLQSAWVPLQWDKNGVEILVDDPRNLMKTDNIRSLIRAKLYFSVGIKEDIEAFIRHFFEEKKLEEEAGMSEFDTDFDLMPDVAFEEEEDAYEEDEGYDEASGQVVKLVDQVLVAAYRQNASDIHIEPSAITKATTIRFRMDGVCQEYLQLPNTLAKGIMSRIKIMSELDIAERRLPQDGKIKFKRKGIPPFELRVATLPTAGGFEDAVLRILAKAGAMKLDDMGLLERNLRVLKEIISQPYGLVLVVGPTGSGKTTSLHAALGHINKPGIKIWTAEDPVEISQPGLRQVEAKPKIGLDFERIMRAFLRADPDVIMIGEMRDQETAGIGVEASLTGHLVFSTLHTNSAPETITRLLDMGLNPLNFSDAFLGVMAQRLARRLCKNCKEAYHPSEEEFDDIVQDFGRDYWEATGIQYTDDLTLHRPVGCEECSNVGYKGRLGVHELMEGTPDVKRLIKKAEETELIFKQAIEDGMNTLKQDGLVKVFQGISDVKEIRRICIN